MTPIQQLYLGVGASEKTYVDDVFSTFLYEGTGTESGSTGQTINNGIDFTGKGGMTWIKVRTGTTRHAVVDTVRGAGKMLSASESVASTAADLTGVASFNSNGFTLGNESGGYQRVNMNNQDYASWSFRKAPGFFDVVTYTGNGSNRTIAHSLGSVPGMIMVKCTSESRDWAIYHRNLEGTSGNEDNAGTAIIFLNTTEGGSHNDEYWNDTAPTSTHFSVGTQNGTNKNGATYVAYVFAGGESTAATARSVDLDASGDYLDVVGSSDFSFGSGDFTVEGWFKVNSTSAAQTIIGVWDNTNNQRSWLVEANNSGGLLFSVSNNGSSTTDVVGSNCVFPGQWTHFAAVRDGDNLKLFVNGTQVASSSYSMTLYDNTNDKCFIGLLNGASNKLTGKLSNIRVVKGTAVYTSSFKPPTEPLTNITNTKLLCCNNASVTGSTVTPGTIDATGDPTASTDSPFDDPAAFTFGDAKESVIKCGSYVGNGSSTGPEINLGWEPQYVLIKNASSGSTSWNIWDSMRGIVTGGNDIQLYTDREQEEYTGADRVDLTSTGFKLKQNNSLINTSGDTYIYMCIRRSDGYVGKPADAGTGVFAMDTGAGSSTIPNFDSTFPVDFALRKNTNNSGTNWRIAARLIQGKFLEANNTNAISTSADLAAFDSNVGFGQDGADSNYQAWMFKRHSGFDVVHYKGDGVYGRQVPHSLNAVPEMIWVKNREENGEEWIVYHKGLDGGNQPETHNLYLHNSDAELDTNAAWNDTAPTSTHFTLGGGNAVNKSTKDNLAFLFASVSGISKCGSYTGTGSSFSVTCGFQPRFLIIRRTDSANDWRVFDTGRGWTSSDNNMMILNGTGTEDSGNYVNHNSTGFTLTTSADVNASSGNYVYYAHA